MVNHFIYSYQAMFIQHNQCSVWISILKEPCCTVSGRSGDSEVLCMAIAKWFQRKVNLKLFYATMWNKSNDYQLKHLIRKFIKKNMLVEIF